MKIVYPSPIPKTGTLDYIHKLEARLAHRTGGHSHFTRRMRCRTKLLVARVLDKIERLLK